ncbi:hypothetical protein QR680_019274 [Steinernema hermaphroditum]|uniref:Innexin n=1 Tax=Steinernema hermaphroditum TaxID=289476 RepID=A0AA39HLV1_9BILA|nr:hypothetical protein QR680_019274 [Steinernema hermaphroditum]
MFIGSEVFPLIGFLNDPLDDLIDRLNGSVAFGITMMLTVLAFGQVQFGRAITCLLPNPRAPIHSHVEHYLQRCYIEGLYRLDEKDMPDLSRGRLAYYMWYPYIFLAMSLFSILPKLFWKVMLHFHNTDFRAMVLEAEKLSSLSGEDHEIQLVRCAKIIQDSCEINKRSSKITGTVAYICTKLLYVGIVAFQLFITSHIVDDGFPLKGQCILEFHEPQDTESMECTLPLNGFYHSVFTFYLIWSSFLSAITFTSALCSTSNLLIPALRRRLLKKLLMWPNTKIDRKSHVIDFLGADGILLLVLIKQHNGAIVANDIAKEIYMQSMDRIAEDLR